MSWEFAFLAMQILYMVEWTGAAIPRVSTAGLLKSFVKENIADIQEDYNPNHGFEPYWPGGDWLFEDPKVPENETTTKAPLVCGEECNYLYTRIGAVCARQASNIDHEQCYHTFNIFCYEMFDQFWRGFRTFDSYCEFLDAQCRTPISDRWLLVKEGPCAHDIYDYFKSMEYVSDPLGRVPEYFTKLVKNFKTADLPSPLRQQIKAPLK